MTLTQESVHAGKTGAVVCSDQVDLDAPVLSSSRDNPAHAWFESARFGMFIHFSYFSAFGNATCGHKDFEEDYRAYEAGIRDFAPQHLDPEQWVLLAKRGGCRYIILTAKHEEGFCWWDTRTTTFNSINSAYGGDLLRVFVDACQRHDMPYGFYLTQGGSGSPYLPSHPRSCSERSWDREDDDPDLDKHLALICEQLTELLTGYGKVRCIWFDGSHRTEQAWRGRKLYEHVKSLQPDCLVNERAGYGDYFTPEWHLRRDIDPDRYLVESCVCVAENGWGWIPEVPHHNAQWCVDTLIEMVSCGSNLLLNVSPDADGVVPAEQSEAFLAMGRWLAVNGEAVYGSQALELDGLPDELRATRRGNDVFLFLRRGSTYTHVDVPGLARPPEQVDLLGGGELAGAMHRGTLRISGLPCAPDGPLPNVLRLRYAAEPPIRRRPLQPIREVVFPLRAHTDMTVSVKDASTVGMGYKGETLRIERLQAPDAAISLPPRHDDYTYHDIHELDRMMTDSAELWATMNWRSTCMRLVWHLDVREAMRVRLHLQLRCSEVFAGSPFTVSCGDDSLTASTIGEPGSGDLTANWFKGWYTLPMHWQTLGELDLPQGRQRLTIQPDDFAQFYFFADVAALRIETVSQR